MDSIFNYEHPFVCTDAVVFTIETIDSDSSRKSPMTNLKILLYKREAEPHQNKWCLPGGFLSIDETPEDCIRKKLSEKSQVDNCWLEQLYTFCGTERDPRARVISIAYLGLMNEAESVKLKDRAVWFTVRPNGTQRFVFENGEFELTEQNFGFDHYSIINTAMDRLRSKILYTDIALNLLPHEFTLGQLQSIYETILNEKDYATNFRRKIMHMVQETDQHTSGDMHRPAKLYIRKQEEN